jgi:hypothetical protein
VVKQSLFIKILGVVGTIIVWIPILMPMLFSFVSIVTEQWFRFDYLMPAELFPIALLGGGLLVWTTLRTHLYRKLIVLNFTIAVGSLIVGQILTVITGLASGEIGPSGWQWTLVLLSIIIYVLALIGIGVGGVLLSRKLFRGSSN